MFCGRARVAGAGGGGVGRGGGAAAPQVVLLRRGPIPGDEPRAPAAGPPARRPLAAPSSCASPLRAPPPLPALRLRVPAAALPAGTAGRSGRRAGSLVGCGKGGAGAARGRGVGPGCGLWRGQARRRRDAAAAITGLDQAPPRSSLSSLHRRPGAPPAREWEGDGAPPPALRKRAASRSTPAAARRGATCGRGLALDRPFLVLLG